MTGENLPQLKHKLGSILKYNIEGDKKTHPDVRVRPFFIWVLCPYGGKGGLFRGDTWLTHITYPHQSPPSNNLPTKHPKTTKNSGYSFNIMGTPSLWAQCAPNTVYARENKRENNPL
jgi:hypothetical protein